MEIKSLSSTILLIMCVMVVMLEVKPSPRSSAWRRKGVRQTALARQSDRDPQGQTSAEKHSVGVSVQTLPHLGSASREMLESWATGLDDSTGTSPYTDVILGPPHAPPCSDPSMTMKGVWVHRSQDTTADKVCRSTIPRILALCTGSMGRNDSVYGPAGNVFRPTSCRLQVYSSAAARRLLNRTSVHIVGESFQRHVHVGLLAILSDNYERGMLDRNRFKKETSWLFCTLARQFTVKECSKGGTFGPTAGGGGVTYVNIETIARFLKGTRSEAMEQHDWNVWPRVDILVAGMGLHDKGRQYRKHSWTSLGTIMEERVLEPLGRTLAAAKPRQAESSTRRRVLWMPLQSQGSRKPAQYRSTQNNRAIRPFNVHVATAAPKHGIEVFDTFNVTAGAYSYDGTHFGMTLNLVRAHCLLNKFASSIDTK